MRFISETVYDLFVGFSLQEVYESKRSEHLNELQRKEDEMRQMFVMRVREKEGELKKSEKEVRVRLLELIALLWSFELKVSVLNYEQDFVSNYLLEEF